VRAVRPRLEAVRALPGPLVRLLQLALTVLVTWFIVDRIGLSLTELSRFDPARWEPRWGVLAASCLLLAAGYALSSLLWGAMVRSLGGPRLRPWATIRVFMLANLGRYVPGKVLQIAGLAYLARREGVPPGVATMAALLGQGVALLGATLIGLGAFFGPNEAWRRWGWIGLAVVLTFVVLASVPGPAAALEGAWLRLVGRAREPATDAVGDPAHTAPPPPPTLTRGFGLRWTLAYALNWGLYAAAFWLLFLGLEGWTTFLQAGPAFAAAYVAGYVAVFAPAGVGVREVSLVAFLSPVLAPEPAAALAVVARLWTTGVELVPAALLAAWHLRRPVDPTNQRQGG
jgi:uncharacterized membrane protein YbhN (UPF0104 family)